jgi:non-heme chloroperoxidase
MPTVDVAGGSLFWSEAGAGPVVLLVHGIPTDHRAWSAQMAALAPDHRAIAVSRRYAFPNERPGDARDSTIEANAADLEDFMAHLGVAPVHLVGHSYGGFVAAFLAVKRPELLRSLVLVEPAIASLLLKDPRSRGEAFALLLRHPGAALSASRYLRTSQRPALAALDRGDGASAVRLNVDGIQDRVGAFDALPPSVREMTLANARTVREIDLPYPALGPRELARIRCPTLVLNGALSAPWLRTIGRIATPAIPRCERAIVPGARHFPHLENPEWFNATLRGFLARVGTAG